MKKPATNSPMEGLRKEELQAVRELQQTLPAGFSWSRSLKTARATGKTYRASAKAMWGERRTAIGDIYPLLIAAGADPARFAEIISACDAAGIALRAPVHPAVALVRLNLQTPSDDSINRYANVLREALLERIPADQLAAHLGKRGCGINAMSAAYRGRMKRVGRGDGGPAGQPARQLDDEAEERHQADGATLVLKLEWSTKGQKIWHSAKVGTRPIVIEKVDERRGKVHARAKTN